MSTTIDLLRHGALKGGVRYRGVQDDPLTDDGLQSMHAVWEHISSRIDVIFSSPLSRCAGPAQSWATQSDIPLVLDQRLQEMAYGAWEGLDFEQIEATFPGMLAAWRDHPSEIAIPDAEPVHAFVERVRDAWQSMLATYEGQRILVVSHSGTIRLLLTLCLDVPFDVTRRIHMPYASWSQCQWDGERGSVHFINQRPFSS